MNDLCPQKNKKKESKIAFKVAKPEDQLGQMDGKVICKRESETLLKVIKPQRIYWMAG